jgi:hypothetical protein
MNADALLKGSNAASWFVVMSAPGMTLMTFIGVYLRLSADSKPYV